MVYTIQHRFIKYAVRSLIYSHSVPRYLSEFNSAPEISFKAVMKNNNNNSHCFILNEKGIHITFNLLISTFSTNLTNFYIPASVALQKIGYNYIILQKKTVISNRASVILHSQQSV